METCKTYQDIYYSQMGKEEEIDEYGNEQKLQERNIPGMNRHERFTQTEHAQNAGAALKKLAAYFIRKVMVASMLIVVIFGTLCGVYAPSLQSSAIDIIAGSRDEYSSQHWSLCWPYTCSTVSVSCSRTLSAPI